MGDNSKLSPATRLAQLGHFVDPQTGAVAPPIHVATTFGRDADYALKDGRSYSRDQNPTYEPVEALLAELDGGAAALLFASGMAAATAVFETLRSGDRVVAPQIMYHGLQTWLRRLAETRGIELALFDATDPAALGCAVGDRAAVVWIETLCNPSWDVIDIAAAAEIAHSVGAILAVDSTVSPPVTTRPLELGADLVFHSATKYLNGHSDVLGGALVTWALDARWEEIRTVRHLAGGVIGSFEAWLLGRGLRTLAIRYERASSNALRIAEHLQSHPAIERVLYPGLPSHPGHEAAARQMQGGFGGMLSLCVHGGAEAAQRVASATRLFFPATSLGGVESLIEHRASVEGPLSHVPQNLLRLSVGIEDAGDLIADLEQALGNVSGGSEGE